MNSFSTARIDFCGTPPPSHRFVASTRLSYELAGRPGKWSVAVELGGDVIEQVAMATVRFVSSDAPQKYLRKGQELELYEGPKVIGRARILNIVSPNKLKESIQ